MISSNAYESFTILGNAIRLLGIHSSALIRQISCSLQAFDLFILEIHQHSHSSIAANLGDDHSRNDTSAHIHKSCQILWFVKISKVAPKVQILEGTEISQKCMLFFGKEEFDSSQANNEEIENYVANIVASSR